MQPGSTEKRSKAMHRAVRIFPFDERGANSPFIEKIWRTRSAPYEAFISVAVTHWEMVVTRQAGRAHLTVRGPETRATTVDIPANAEFFGIQFKLGAFMPGLPVGSLVDGALNLPEAPGRSFRLDGSTCELPDYDNADTFVKKLARKGLLVRDEAVVAALLDRPLDLSARTVERRVLRATGLTRRAMKAIERAGTAADLLDGGATILDAVARAGYADQSHLTRALRRFIGQTPAQIVHETA